MTQRAAIPIVAGLIALAVPAGSLAAATITTLGITGSAPRGIVLDATGNVYTTSFNSGTVVRITQAGTSSVYATAGSNAYGIAMDSNGSIFTANASSISKITGASQSATFASGFATVQSTIGVAPNGDVVVGGNGQTGAIRRFSADGTLIATTTPSPLVAIRGIVFDPAGNAYVTAAYGSSQQVWKITPNGAVAWRVDAADAWGIARDAAGNLYTSPDNTTRKIFKVSPDGVLIGPDGAPTQSPLATLPAGTDYLGITIDSAGNLYTANNSTTPYKAYRITPAGGVSELGTVTGDKPYNLAIDASGALYTVNGSSLSNNVTKITDSSIAAALPQVPAAPTAVAGSGSAVVTITPNAASARYGTPTSYTVAAVQDPSKTCTVTPPATSCTITGLAAGTAYTFTASANLGSSSVGPSAASDAVTTAAAPQAATSASGSTPSTPATPSNVFSIQAARPTGATVRTRIRVPGPGRITQRGTYRTGGSASEMFQFATRTACTAKATSTAAGTVTVTCRLTAAARRARTRTPLRVSLSTTFTPTGGTARSTSRTVVFAALRPRPVPNPRVTG